MNEVELGDLVKDKVSGVKGVVFVIHDYLYGVNRMGFQPEGSFEGKQHEAIHVDMPQVDIIKKGKVEVPHANITDIKHGDKVRCKITKFEGIAVGNSTWMYGCLKILVQPQKLEKKSGKPYESMWIDEPQLKIIKPQKKTKIEPIKSTGGFNDNVYTHNISKR